MKVQPPSPTVWSINSYHAPYLRIDKLEATGPRELVVTSRGQQFDLTTPQEIGAHDLEGLLARMRDPNDPVWAELRHEAKWGALLDYLDMYGLIAEADSHIDDSRDNTLRVYTDFADRAQSWLTEVAAALTAQEIELLQSSARAALRLADRLLVDIAAEVGIDSTERSGDGDGRPSCRPLQDIYGCVLDHELMHWRQTDPQTVALICQVLWNSGLTSSDTAVIDSKLTCRVLAQLAGGPYDLQDIGANLTCFTELLAKSAGVNRVRMLDGRSLIGARDSWCSGTNLAIEAEQLALSALGEIGQSRFYAALSNKRPVHRLAQGTYVEQFHLTRRFVEVIVPVLAKRLTRPLRTRMFKYYEEEVGHEFFELEACLALGLDREAVERATPLPGWTSYLDVFARVATIDPIGFLASILITEGLPGTHTPVNDLLEAANAFAGTDVSEVIRAHEELNVELDHTTLARRFLSEVPAISPHAQHVALEHMLLLLELNYRAWDDLWCYYTNPEVETLHQDFGIPPRQMVGLMRSEIPRHRLL